MKTHRAPPPPPGAAARSSVSVGEFACDRCQSVRQGTEASRPSKQGSRITPRTSGRAGTSLRCTRPSFCGRRPRRNWPLVREDDKEGEEGPPRSMAATTYRYSSWFGGWRCLWGMWDLETARKGFIVWCVPAHTYHHGGDTHAVAPLDLPPVQTSHDRLRNDALVGGWLLV